MGSEFGIAIVGLVGALLGAGAGLIGTIYVERGRVRQEAVERLLAGFAEAIVPADPQKARAISSKLRLACAADEKALTGWVNQSDPEANLNALIGVLAGVMNDTRRRQGLAPLPHGTVARVVRGNG